MAAQIKAWWWRPRKRKNFGDEISALMLKKMGYKVKRVALEKADLVLGGTIMDTVDKRAKDGVAIWGAGVAWEHEAENRFNILAMRGKLSANTYGVDVPLGDPGLLTSLFYARDVPKYDIGVVRHYVDKEEYPWADIVIDATEPVETVIRKISQCRTICSSSLHGVIVANSFGIPAMRIYNEEVISGNVKWNDYQTALTQGIAQVQVQLVRAIEDNDESFSSR